MRKLENRRFGYVRAGDSGGITCMQDHQQIAGYSVGIIYIEDVWYPFMPGNVVNAYTYDFPVRMRAVPNLTIDRLFRVEPGIADDIIALGRHMIEKEGVRAISSACGFFGNFHKQVAENLSVPVALSSLVQIPWIKSVIKPEQKIGVITADASSLTDSLLKNCFVDDRDVVVIKDMRKKKQFSAILEYRGEFDNEKVKKEMVEVSVELTTENDNIGAILFECSDMPPYAYAVQAATQLPVFDFITLIRWLHYGLTQRPYDGWI